MEETGISAAPRSAQPLAFDLVTLGAAALVRPDGRLVLDRSKQLALLTWLHAAPRRSARREQLCALLWGDSPPLSASRAFRTTLSRMRAALGEEPGDAQGSEVTLHTAIRSDRELFLAAVHAGDLECAVRLYTGPFFPAYSDAGSIEFEEWVEVERARLQELFTRSADSLVRRHLDRGHPVKAIEVARRVRSVAPDVEAGWRLLLESLVAAHDDLGARAEAEGLRRWLAQSDREPDARTARLLVVVGQGGAEAEQPSGTALVAELVGREQEYSFIQLAWQQASRGSPRHLHLQARAGFGKTRLLAEVAARLRTQGTVVTVRATPGERDVDYALAAELARALGNAPGAPGVNAASTPVLVQLQPALSSRFPAAIPRQPTGDLTMQRAQALGELLGAVADESPVALLIDDWHWSDPESRKILASLSDRLNKNRVLLLTAGRPAASPLPDRASIVGLPPLSVADVTALLVSLGTLPDPEWGDRLTHTLRETTGGSPLLTLETLQLARDRGDLNLEDGRWSAPDLDLLIARLASARALETRLLQLEPSAREILVLLATYGMPLRDQELREIMRPVVLDPIGLSDLERLGFIARSGDGWDVSHDEVAAGVLELAPPEDRAHAHASLGAWLTRTGRDDRATLTRGARHLALGNCVAEIAPVFRRWVKQARREGERAPPKALAEALLGESAEEGQKRELVRSLPLHLRSRSVVPLAGAVGVLAAAGAILALVRPAAPAPEAELLVFRAGVGPEAGIYRLPVSRERWDVSDTLRLTNRTRIGDWPATLASAEVAAGSGIIYSQKVADSGITDLFIREPDGSTRRLTMSAGDDVGPSFSPDGRFVAFQTARFTPRGDEDSDIAILDLASGEVRQISAGPEYDAAPVWSPDGTRIAFSRHTQASGLQQVCWITTDGVREECLGQVPGLPGGVIGWRDPDRFLLSVRTEELTTYLYEVALSSNQFRRLEAPGIVYGEVSPDGVWLTVSRRADGQNELLTELFPIDEPSRRRQLKVNVAEEGVALAWQHPVGGTTPFWSLRIISPDSGVIGLPHRMAADGFDPNGVSRTIAQATIHWRSRDTTVASIDARSGIVTPHRPGKAWIVVSAGGWRLDSTLFRVMNPTYETILLESWVDSTMPAWVRFGTPLPVVWPTGGGASAFLSNGDNAYDSGAYSREGFTGQLGLGMEANLFLPVRRPKWQTIRIVLGKFLGASQDGVSMEGCSFRFPAGEGAAQLNLIAVTAGPEAAHLQAPHWLTDGREHRLRIQVFPDHTCGIALDNRPFWSSIRPIPASFPFQLAIYGRTVGAELLVGPIEVWRGVKPGVSWSLSRSVP